MNIILRKIFISFVFFTVSLIVLTGDVSAQEKQSIKKEEKINDDLSVDILEDGRVAPIEDSDLKEEELDKILSKIGYTDEFIEDQNLETKKELVELGGKVAETKDVESSHEYISDDESYDIDSENKSKIREKQIDDLEEEGFSDDEIDDFVLPRESKITPFANGNKSDGKWSSKVNAVKTGSTKKQYIYKIVMNNNWSKTANAKGTDTAAVAWGTYGEPKEDTDTAKQNITLNNNGQTKTENLNLDLGSKYGFQADIDHPLAGIKHSSTLSEEIYISKSHKDEKLAISAEYDHPWTSNTWNLSIGAGSISASGVVGKGDRWTWTYNFTPS